MHDAGDPRIQNGSCASRPQQFGTAVGLVHDDLKHRARRKLRRRILPKGIKSAELGLDIIIQGRMRKKERKKRKRKERTCL